MRTHGWAGSPPGDDAEARSRIVAAARRRLAEAGTATTSDVAELLGVTRQTVYRYYARTEDLLNAAAMDAVTDLVAQLGAHVREYLLETGADAGDAVAEVVAFVYEHLRDDPALNRLIAPGRISSTLAGLTAPSSIDLGRTLLAGFPLDWDEAGLDGEDQRELVEHLLRTLQSLVIDPGYPERSPAELRGFLRRWISPAVRARQMTPKRC